MNNKPVLIFLCLAVLVLGGMMAHDKFAEHREEMFAEAFTNGTTYGSEYMIAVLTEQAIQCKEIPITYGNYTYTLIAVECLDNLNNNGGNK